MPACEEVARGMRWDGDEDGKVAARGGGGDGEGRRRRRCVFVLWGTGVLAPVRRGAWGVRRAACLGPVLNPVLCVLSTVQT